jgi:HPt (histidine-containing phosphotransfer) domain-containing protein
MEEVRRPMFMPQQPKGESVTPCKQPIDLAHLNAQTCGDTGLAGEVLALFVKSARAVVADLDPVAGADTRETAHRLKGSARAIGAFSLADIVSRMESEPRSAQLFTEFQEELARLEEYLASVRP